MGRWDRDEERSSEPPAPEHGRGAGRAGVLKHGIHLRDLRASKVVGDEQVIDRQAAAQNVAAHDEIQLPAEIDWTVGGVYERHLSPGQALLDSLQDIVERRRRGHGPPQLVVTPMQTHHRLCIWTTRFQIVTDPIQVIANEHRHARVLRRFLTGVTQEVLAHTARTRIQNVLCTSCNQKEGQRTLQSQGRAAFCGRFNVGGLVFVDGHERRQCLLDMRNIKKCLAACVTLSWLQ
jgi:hypothetical protein